MSDDISRLLQREIDASHDDIVMRTKLVRALSTYNDEVRTARDRLYADVMSAFGVGARQRQPSLDEIQSAIDQRWRQN